MAPSVDLHSIELDSLSSYSSVFSRETDILYIPYRWTEDTIVEVNVDDYTKHTNLDSRPVSCYEHIHLSRIYYLNWPNLLKFTFVLFTFVIFLFNVNTILVQFAKHNTVVSVEYFEYSNSPAVTICTDSLLDLYLQSNRTIYAEDILQNDYTLVVFNDSRINASSSIDVNIECLVLNNTVESIDSNLHNCGDIVAPIISITDRSALRETSKCWTFLSNLANQMTRSTSPVKEMKFDFSPMVMLKISGPWLDTRQLFVAVHSGDIPASLDEANFHRIQAGKLIDFRISKTTQLFEPNCFQYRTNSNERPDEIDPQVLTTNGKLLTESGISIYRTRGECFVHCMWRQSFDTDRRCISPLSIITQPLMEQVHFYTELNMLKAFSNDLKNLLSNYSLNEDDNSDYWTAFCKVKDLSKKWDEFLDSREQCSKQCPESCTAEIFKESWVVRVDHDLSSQSGYVAVKFAKNTVTQIRHFELTDISDVLGLIGGHLHALAPISVIYLIIKVVRVVQAIDQSSDTSCCIVQWWRRWCCRR